MTINTIDSRRVECVVQTNDQLGETPLWCERSNKLWWLDIEKPKLQCLDTVTGRHHVQVFPEATHLGSQALTESGGHLLARDLDLLLRTEDGTLSPFVTVERDIDNRLNDGRVDRWGRLWIGTMDNELHRANGGLYRIDAAGAVEKLFGDVIVSNGIAFSPDGRRFHFTDTRRYTSYVFDMDPEDGEISGRRVFADYSTTGERPDGACFDADGGLWTAFFAGGRVVRYAPDGRIDTVVHLPTTNPTCVCFGGSDYRTLYVTTAAKFLSDVQREKEPLAGALFAIEGVAQGIPENRFDI
ncbi:SMP-30/gluconolactonase/LRE family protein (plasmid) [Agrobacterium salinitolerans]|uniref:SMP-30/gluconolactonase/LRE family protein n=1 Tax=Agrobacterium TaxID=357 RepID=UPI0011ED5947|nr:MULTISPECIES: SMP-30/gluconolactonase/LRE family protein [Agrobacterium]QXC52954.1 SMP-30/gluconolactonase/LRE family protein [Agrobacterium salinitolerans]TZG32339.1 SMP-30/gluconolactonase/LRE family protein [Agrobacterium sp. B1(2019)]